MKTLDSSVTNVLTMLDDVNANQYSRQSASDGLEEGYDNLLRRTEALWGADFYDGTPTVGNVTAQWERSYIAPLTRATAYFGQMSFTGGHWEREYIGPEVFSNGAYGPVQCTSLFEAQYEYHPETISSETFELPDDIVRMNRVTWDTLTLSPEFGSTLRRDYVRYKDHDSGTPNAFIMDEDGLRYMRLDRTSSDSGTLYTYDGTRGFLRDDSSDELGDSTYRGTRGLLRATDDHLSGGQSRGGPVRICSDDGNTRIEYFRLGKPLSDGYGFELPDRYVRSVEYYACSRLLSDEGPGQDLVLAGLYASRFESEVARLRERINSFALNRRSAFGSRTRMHGKPPLARLPWAYPNG
jgi:hypothetical protein